MKTMRQVLDALSALAPGKDVSAHYCVSRSEALGDREHWSLFVHDTEAIIASACYAADPVAALASLRQQLAPLPPIDASGALDEEIAP